MDIKKPQLVKVEAFAYFFQSGIPGHIQGGSLEKMRVLQHPPEYRRRRCWMCFLVM